MANAWFETVAEAQRRAKKRLPRSVYGALVAGSEKGLTLADNLSSFDQLGFAPHMAIRTASARPSCLTNLNQSCLSGNNSIALWRDASLP